MKENIYKNFKLGEKVKLERCSCISYSPGKCHHHKRIQYIVQDGHNARMGISDSPNYFNTPREGNSWCIPKECFLKKIDNPTFEF